MEHLQLLLLNSWKVTKRSSLIELIGLYKVVSSRPDDLLQMYPVIEVSWEFVDPSQYSYYY